MRQCLFHAFLLLLLPTATGLASTVRFRIIDLSGKPISGVAINYSWTAMPPAFPGSGVATTDAEGRAAVSHPCGPSLGSCCLLTSAVSYSINKQGFRFNHTNGSIGCGLATSDQLVVGTNLPPLAVVSAASFLSTQSSEMITAAFGADLATTTESATLPLKTTLAGRSVLIRDVNGVEKFALMLFVSPTQINYIMPSELTSGLASVRLLDENRNEIRGGLIEIRRVAPGVFTANANGEGVPAAVITRVRPGNVQTVEPVARFDEAQRRFVPLPIDLGPETEFVVLSLFGTGWRQVGSAADVVVRISGVECPVEYAGKQPTIEGLDQMNVRLPRALAGAGVAVVIVTVNGVFANPVQIGIK
jgi:uncharacterized protein (TIGR03437 family)